MCVGLQYETRFAWPFWGLEFFGGCQISVKFVHPRIRACRTNGRNTSTAAAATTTRTTTTTTTAAVVSSNTA